MDLQVFHDPSGRRSRGVRTGLWAVGIPLVAALVFLVVAVASIERHTSPALTGAAKAERLTPVQAAAHTDAETGPWLTAGASQTQGASERVGFYVPWDAAARTSLAAPPVR